MCMISVIVPVYKVEEYLEQCINSILKQTYTDFELILVDDGSPDRCGEICDEYAKKDIRVRVVHKENGGLSDARNAGLKIAKGSWISFIDSDDWIAYNYYETMMRFVNENNDVIVCGISIVDEEGTKIGEYASKTCELDNFSAMKHLIKEDILKQTVWNKIYRRSIIDDIEFVVGKCNEDDFWTYRIIANCRKIQCCQNQLYYYRQRQGSIMNREYSFKRLDELEARKERYLFILKNYPILISDELKSLMFSILYAYQKSLILVDRNEKDKCLKTINEYYYFWKKESGKIIHANKKESIWITMTRVSIKMTAWIRILFRIGG